MIGMTNAVGGNGELNTSSMPIAFWYGTTANTSSSWNVGTTQAQSYNNEYFSYSSGVFTFKKAVTVNIYGRGLGTHTSSGQGVTLQWRISKNGNSNVLANGSGGGSTTDSATATFAVGDRIAIYGKASLNGRCSMTMAIRLPQ